jgi:ABC-type glycerol-3-phosphate transport system substrate-binding protein
MWNQTEPSAQVMQNLMNAFTALHPNITFSVVWNGRQNQTKLQTALAAGTVVDLMDQDADEIAGGMMDQGLGYPLDDYLNEPALDNANVSIKDVFSPGILEQYKAKDGHIYIWSYENNPIMFMYNKDAFTKASITTLPQTWDDFLADNAKIKAAGYSPLTTESNITDFNDYWLTYLIERQKGPGFLMQTVEDKTGNMWKDPVYANSIKLIQDLFTASYFPAGTSGFLWPAGQQLVATDQAAMELIGSWLPTELKSTAAPNFNWGAMPFPAIAGGAGKASDLQIWPEAFMILKSSTHPVEAFEFLKFIMTNANQTTLATTAGEGVTNKNVTWIPALADVQNAANNATTVIKDLDGAESTHANFVANVLNINLTPAFFGKTTPDDFSKNMAAAAATYWQTNTK